MRRRNSCWAKQRGKLVSGMTEIRRAYAEGLTDPNFNITFAADKVEVAEAGDMATSRGRFEQTYTDTSWYQGTADAVR